MKNRSAYLTAVPLACAMFSLAMISCNEDVPYANTAGQGLNSVSAMFATGEYKTDQDAVFTKIIDPTKEEILVEVPWFYPITSNNETSVDEIRLTANLDAACTITPSLGGVHNLADKFHFTLTNKNGIQTRHYITGVRKKLDLKQVLDFKVDSHDIDGVIDHDKLTITLVTADEIVDATATANVSPHASISPDPATPRSYENPVEFTVTAHDGTTAVYTVKKGIPNKVPLGYRPGSEQLMWAKKINADIGIGVYDLTGGMAVTGDYVVLNTQGHPSVYIDRKTGNKVGEINLGAEVTGPFVNYYNTADDSGNILINNCLQGAGTFKVWKLSSVSGTPQLFITYDSTVPIGRKLSIKGSLDGDAIITVGLNSSQSSTFARWKVTGGVLESQTPELVTISGYSWKDNNVDIVHSSPTNITADYFAASYSVNTTAWINGATNAPRAVLTATSGNWIPNAIDHAEFNGNAYILYNAVNSFTWGASDQIVLADVNNSGAFSSPAVDGSGNSVVGGAIKWTSPVATYGGNQGAAVVNGTGTGDVALKVSPDGYYLYAYFMFTNGYVVCYRFDCIEK